MRVLVSDDILADAAQWPDLETLLDCARRNRCYVDVLNPESAAANPWFNQADSRRKQEWTNVLDWAVKDSALYRLNTVVAATHDDPSACPHARIKLSETLELVDQAYVLWVENDRNDRRFLLAMMHPEQRAMLRTWESRRVIQINSRGGLGELRVALEELFGRGALDPRKNRALFDSDAEAPGHPSRDASAMTEFCQKVGIRSHCLTRRAIENYIPLKALWNWVYAVGGRSRAERKRKLEALTRLAAEQRYHFRMKSGWEKTPSERVKSLYEGISVSDRRALEHGIDNNIASVYDTYSAAIYEWAKNEGIDSGLQSTMNDLIDWIRVPYA